MELRSFINAKTVLTVIFLNCFFNSLLLKAQHKEVDSLKHVLSKMPDDTNKVKTMGLLFIAAIDSLSANEALPVAIQQLELAKKLHYEKGEAKAYRLLSVGYETLGDIQKGIEASLNSLKIYEKLKDNAGMAGCFNNIGITYLDENDLDEALVYFKKSLGVYSKYQNKPENIWRGEINIARVYEKQNKDSLALINYLQSLSTGKNIKQNQNVYVANSLYHIGNIYFNKRDYNASKDYLTKALTLLAGAREAYPLSEIYFLLSKLYIVQNQFNKTLQTAKTGLGVVEKVNYKSGLAAGYLQVSNVYAALKSYSEAYHYQTLYIKLKDSLLNAENIRRIEKLQYGYKLEKKENTNRELLKDKKLEQSKNLLQKITIQRQYAVGGFIGLGLLSFIVISVFYYRNFQLKKRDNELLNLQQQEILQQNHEILAQNDEISSQKEHLTELNKTKTKLFSVISHDLRAPVSTLQELLTMFNDELITHDEMEVLSAEMLINVANTSAMLDNVLYWAKSQMEGMSINTAVFNIQKLISTNLLNFKKQASNKKINIINKVDHEINVSADPATIDIVIRNLVSNAIKFCRANDVITIATVSKDKFLHISVTDTGEGMSEEVQQKLFKPAEYYTTYGTSNEKGTGLGLNLCRDYVMLNGGEIWVESLPGKGSAFTFIVPLA